MASPRMEDYLKAIRKMEDRGEPVTTSALARECEVALPSVTQMLHRLHERGLLLYEPKGGMSLTEAGRDLALSVTRRHRLWERFLHDVLGLRWERVHEEACRLEHATSLEVENRLAQALETSRSSPTSHAVPLASAPDRPASLAAIPQLVARTEGEAEGVTTLCSLPPGEVGVIQSLHGGRSFVARCLALGFTPGVQVKVVQNSGSGPLIVLVRDTRVALGRGEAQKVLVGNTKRRTYVQAS